ncbi:hypothetical protein [Zobellella aerophila]|uniref:RiboL-PSP-HEPN domain-containing protein n=1 Tax=Zobellella aerophila TaxID=870480 RepID=A0ABP6VAG0_9GAMM
MKKKRLVKKEVTKNIYVHNDISNAAFHLKERIEKNHAAGNNEGISLDIMSCLIMYAFEFEAKVNFVGHMKILNWKERDSFHKKVKKINNVLGIKVDKNSRPYTTIEYLKSYRDSIAHGKPFNSQNTETSKMLSEEINSAIDLDNGLYDLCTISFMRECEADIENIWKNWLNVASIDIDKTITHGSFSAEIL